MRTSFDDALAKAPAGLVPRSEILRAVPYRMLSPPDLVPLGAL
jgi:hypothetical protein